MLTVKICGITNREQGHAIAKLGVNVLGFICVQSSPRYVKSEIIRDIVSDLPQNIDKIAVFAHSSLAEIEQVVKISGVTGIQLHGSEDPEFCKKVKQLLPNYQLIKALRIKDETNLQEALAYTKYIDILLLDAYDPHLLGGTGKTLNWEILANFKPCCPWWLAGGLNPDNIRDALAQVHPHGIDLSSGVEISPGNKDLTKIAQLFDILACLPQRHEKTK